jgi:hypothetical protein
VPGQSLPRFQHSLAGAERAATVNCGKLWSREECAAQNSPENPAGYVQCVDARQSKPRCVQREQTWREYWALRTSPVQAPGTGKLSPVRGDIDRAKASLAPLLRVLRVSGQAVMQSRFATVGTGDSLAEVAVAVSDGCVCACRCERRWSACGPGEVRQWLPRSLVGLTGAAGWRASCPRGQACP